MTLVLYTVIRARLDAPRATAHWPARVFGSRRVSGQTVEMLDAHGRRTTDSGVLVTLGGVTVPSVAGVATFPSDRYEADPALAGLPVTLRAGLAGEACVSETAPCPQCKGRGTLGGHPQSMHDMRCGVCEQWRGSGWVTVAERVPQAEPRVATDRDYAPWDPTLLRERSYFRRDAMEAWVVDEAAARTAELARRAKRECDAPGPDLGGPAMPVPYGIMAQMPGARVRTMHAGPDGIMRASDPLPRAPVAAEIARLAEQEEQQARPRTTGLAQRVGPVTRTPEQQATYDRIMGQQAPPRPRRTRRKKAGQRTNRSGRTT